jgi:hypothetical protein
MNLTARELEKLRLSPPDPDRKCWKGHLFPTGVLTGLVRFGMMIFTCHDHFDELQALPMDDDYAARRDN